LGGWIAWGRAMGCDVVARAGSERAADRSVELPEQAARPSRAAAKANVRHRARGGDVREWKA